MYFSQAIQMYQIKDSLDRLEKIRKMMDNLEQRKLNCERYIRQQHSFHNVRVKSHQWINHYPKVLARLERMFQTELHKLVDLEYTADNFKSTLLEYYGDRELKDYLGDYVFETI